MKNVIAAAIVLVTVLLVTAAGVSAQTRVTVDEILGMKAVGPPAVSPDGTQVLYTVRQWEPDKERMESRTRIWRVAAAGGPARQMTFGERGDAQPQWSPDGRYISFVSARGAGAPDDPPRAQIYLMPSAGGEALKLTDLKEAVASHAWASDSRRIAFVSTDPRSADEESAVKKRDDERVFEGDFRYQHVSTIDVDSRQVTRVTSGRTYTVTGPPSWSSDGSRVAFSAKPTPMIRDHRSDVFIATLAGSVIDRISTNPGADDQPQWSPDGASIAWVSEPAAGRAIADGTLPAYVGNAHLVIYDVGRRTLKDVSAPEFDGDPGVPQWTADSRRIVFVSGTRAYSEAFSFDVASGKYAQLSRQKTLSSVSRSKDGTMVVVAMDSPELPGELYATDGTFASFRRLTTTNPQAAAFALGRSEVVSWKGSDGMDVEGVLLKPVDFDAAKRYPLLVVAHGGPSGAYTNNYRVGGLEGGQMWAANGWAVLYPNPRGSTNYGEKFLRANVNDWGGGDYNDIMTGVDAMIARGIADPDRLAHIGWSYGGYLTAWAITQTSRFKAAVVGAGLTNLASMYGTNDIPNALVGYFGGILGKDTMPLYAARSAMSFIDKVTTPTLILHGGSDERVPTGQAFELFRGLKDRGKTTELVFYPREGHGISEYYHLRDRLTRIYDWVTRYTVGAGKTSQN